jgi:hypothetical protein
MANARGAGLKSVAPPGIAGAAFQEAVMGINSESDTTANLQIGPTSLGMVRIYVAGDGVDLPMDFEPEEAEEIAEEIRAAAAQARAIAEAGPKKPGRKKR